MIYLASPYSNKDPRVREDRFDAACQSTAALMRHGCFLFSPIVHSHPLVRYGLPTTWDYWESVDRKYLEICDEVVVLTLPGWQESRGVQAEIRIAAELGKPVRYLDPATLPTWAHAVSGEGVRS